MRPHAERLMPCPPPTRSWLLALLPSALTLPLICNNEPCRQSAAGEKRARPLRCAGVVALQLRRTRP
jgi:hypothetical protein